MLNTSEFVTQETCLPENNKFPPSPSKHYINLAYIARRTQSKHESEKFKMAMVRGEIDEIAHDKGLDFSHVAGTLPDGSYPQLVLVEGAPGVGKTTFAWEFCKKWGKGEFKQEYSLVILLRLRDKRIQEAKCLRDLFYHPDETLPDVIAMELISNLGEEVLILLEGLDELPESQRTDSSVFLDLIHGHLLPLATILITTRPWASEYLHKNCEEKISQHVEILGFTKQQIKNYLQSVCKADDDPSLLSDIEKYLSCYPQIHAAMYIPLNAAIVVQVYRRSRIGECIIPKTMTQLYTALSQTLLIRYLEEHPVHRKTKWKIHNFSDLPSDVYEHFLQLSELAYISIKNDQKLIFSSEDLPSNLETLGFMLSVPELYVNEAFSYNFLHLTMQEYLAALYITRLSPEEQLKYFKECKLNWSKKIGDGLFQVVMRFVAGLTQFSGIPSDSIRALFKEPKDSSNDPNAQSQYYVKGGYVVYNDHVRWMFETQDPCKIDSILGSNTTEFHGDPFTMSFDFYCLGYCISHSHCQWRLEFFETITEDNSKMFTLGGSALHISKQTACIVSATPEVVVCLFNTLPLNFRVDLQEVTGYSGNVDFSTLIKRLRLQPSLKVIDFAWLNATDSDRLIRALRLLPSLIVLELSYATVTVVAFRELCNLLASTSNYLKSIVISEDDEYPDCEYFSTTIEGTYQHTSVSVDVVISNVADAFSVAAVLRENSNLGLHFTGISMHGLCGNIDGCHLVEALHDTATVRRLNLCHNPLAMKDAMAFVIHSIRSLEEVDVSCCEIDSEGAYHLTQSLCTENSKVRKVDFSSNPRIIEEVMALAKLIQSLEEADLSYCNIGSEGACHLAKALCESTTLRELNLSKNPIGQEGSVKEGIHKLLEAMTVNSTIQKLTLPRECEEYAKRFPTFSEVSSRVYFLE